MKTMFDVQDEVFIKCKITEIHVNDNGKVLYKVDPVTPLRYGDCDTFLWMSEDRLISQLAFQVGDKIPIN